MNDMIHILRQHEGLWDLYTLKKEYLPQELDQHGRITYAHGSNQYVLEPRVSKYLINNEFKFKYPDDKHFAVCLTHDVDEIYPPLKHSLLSSFTSLKDLDFEGLRRRVFWKLHGKDRSPYLNFQEIMDLEEKYGARSSFYFLATDSDVRRFRYNIEDLDDKLGRIVDRGWEVGLHSGYYAHNDLDIIIREKERLEQVLGKRVIGHRSHYLRFQVPNSWEILEKAGFEYDTTLAYPDAIGFRNGMCHPFRPYNLRSNMEHRIIEIPMAIMDGILFDYAGSYNDAWKMTKRLIDTVAECNGVLTLNWHNECFTCAFRRSWLKLYETALDYCRMSNAWMVSAKEISGWWSKNDYSIN